MLRSLKYIAIILMLCSFGIPKNIQKKVDKEIKAAFNVESFSLKPIDMDLEASIKLPAEFGSLNLLEIISNSNQLGYVYLGKAPSKTDEFDYLIVFDEQFIIKKTKVLIYREDYGGEIGSKRWLRQFEGKSQTDELELHHDIIAISGATISVRSMTKAVNDVLRSIQILQKNQRL